MYDIELLLNYQERLDKVTRQLHVACEQYAIARRSQAELQYDIELEIAKVLASYREQKRNLGYDMAILMRLEQAVNEDDLAFPEKYKRFLYETSMYKGNEKAIEAMQSEIMAIQSLMKYVSSGEIHEKR